MATSGVGGREGLPYAGCSDPSRSRLPGRGNPAGSAISFHVTVAWWSDTVAWIRETTDNGGPPQPPFDIPNLQTRNGIVA